ncbi:hypothetical protein BU23DRAFT_565767 [Bimuria novae-zelandiae CBS 107.79]|uniref:Uncharacterized protein n=1 Tax=Bimuria novae-zelandiae CBS 107.79 TaxID=1447943 RepID=A0A6A5VJL7_9PLEO|nr:hypothetical protein BU23DRAFT_565767 [Bimuria novae-zelandiae CBS 107.79]
MDLASSPRPQLASDRASLWRRFGVLRVTVKSFITKLPGDLERAGTAKDSNKITLRSAGSGHISSKDWDYIMAITDPDMSDSSLPTSEDATTETSNDSLPDQPTEPRTSIEDSEVLDDSHSEPSENGSKHRDARAATEALNERWKVMRNPPEGHVHNVYCPFWRPGDTTAPRPECPEDRTFTLFSGNPFTKAGAAHLEQWEDLHSLSRS